MRSVTRLNWQTNLSFSTSKIISNSLIPKSTISVKLSRRFGSNVKSKTPTFETLSTEIESLKTLITKQDTLLNRILEKFDQKSSKFDGNQAQSKTSEVNQVKTEVKLKVDGPIKKNPRGFMDIHRHAEPYRSSKMRLRDWAEINSAGHKDPVELKKQASRCMDCGTPFCQTHTGCPVNNLIPEWNALVLENQWELAIERLHATNNFPEFTGRVCPAPCEGACVAGLIDDPVTIKNIEYKIIDTAFQNGWVKPRIIPQQLRTGKKVAVIGSGPAGLACADMLNQAGHTVTVYERADKIGGLMYYGIPNMKIDKRQVDRRVNLLREEGIVFKENSTVGDNVDPKKLKENNDAVVLCVGSTVPRKLDVPGGDLKGVHVAMDFLTSSQKHLKLNPETDKWEMKPDENMISAEGKNVVVIGGGDTGTDCIATSLRQYCKSLVNLELLPKNPNTRDAETNPWPLYPKIYRVDYGHAEADTLFGHDPRKYSVATTELVDDGHGNVKAVKTILVQKDSETGDLVKVEGTETLHPAELVLLAMGFVGPEKPLLQKFGVKEDSRGNVKADYGKFRTSDNKIFAAGDCRRGQSLVVWAINEGRGAAEAVDKFLTSK